MAFSLFKLSRFSAQACFAIKCGDRYIVPLRHTDRQWRNPDNRCGRLLGELKSVWRRSAEQCAARALPTFRNRPPTDCLTAARLPAALQSQASAGALVAVMRKVFFIAHSSNSSLAQRIIDFNQLVDQCVKTAVPHQLLPGRLQCLIGQRVRHGFLAALFARQYPYRAMVG